MSVFRQLLPSLEKVEKLILNGIGEPLLHPELRDIIRLARSRMQADAHIGFQSNGVLLDYNWSLDLIDAGLDTICLSVDGLDETTGDFSQKRREHSFAAVERAVANLNRARNDTGGTISIGLETVLTRENIHELEPLVDWAAGNGVDYILTTHLILYDRKNERTTLFNPNSVSAIRLFDYYEKKARSMGIVLQDCFDVYRKYAGTRSSAGELQLFADMRRDARDNDIRLNLDGLITYSEIEADKVMSVIQRSQRTAEERGINLMVPPLHAPDTRECQFITDRSVFIVPNGDVMPCHFLWHTYTCQVHSEEVAVRKRVMGNILSSSLTEIWQGSGYESFRKEVERSEYSFCWSCPSGPCPNLVNDNEKFANDCHGSMVPCGHCQWNLGGIHCL